MIEPHDYQRDGLNQIYTLFKTKNKILYQLSTGGGKTFVFSFLSKYWIENKKQRVLILCHRSELVKQTIESMNMIGVTCEAVTSRTKHLKHHSDCYVAMIETASNRLIKDPYFFKNVGLVVADECHILIFDKVFDYFKNSKILGCSATPVVMKRIKFWKCKYCKTEHPTITQCCDNEAEEWSRPFSLSEIYEDIVVGPPIDLLIERGTLVKELAFIKDYADSDKLEVDSDGEFTTKSMDNAYSSDDAVFNVLLNYKQLCHGKKTMVFNSSSSTNLVLYKKFIEAGYNARMYDSVNKKESGNRAELIKWFRETPDAVLLNVGVFTTGFDVKEVEAIILNRPTNSLSLFIQIAGRGARSTDKIYKDHFVLVDGGGNIDRHQEFSDKTRDWKKIFFEGQGKPKAKKEDAFDVQCCSNKECGALYPKNAPECPECGFVEVPEDKPKQPKSLSEEVLMPIRKIPPPDPKKIYQYTVKKEENINFSFKIMTVQIVDMFRYYRVTKELYEKSKASGKLEKKIKQMTHPCYFFLLGQKDIQASNNRTLNYLINKVLNNLEQYYGS